MTTTTTPWAIAFHFVLAFMVLKLVGVIDWHWVLVWSPVWVLLVVAMVARASLAALTTVKVKGGSK